MKNGMRIIASLVLAGTFLNCSSSSTSATSSTTTELDSASGSVVAAAFGGGGDASRSAPVALSMKLLNLFVKKAVAQGAPPSTCDAIEGDPSSVDSSTVDPDMATQTTKTYGPSNNSSENVTLTEDDFCEDTEGNANTADEGEILYAYFTLTDSVDVSCSDGSSGQMLASSEGAWKQDPDNDKCPEIFGTFLISDGTSQQSVGCHIIISCGESEDDSGSVTSAYCENDAGEEMSLDTDTTCEIDAD